MRTIDCIDSIYPKSSRFVYKRNGVFFRTRENDLYGPYKNIGEARSQLEIYLALMNLHEKSATLQAA